MTTDLAPAVQRRTRGKGLTNAERAQLLEIITRSPSLSNRRIAELFTAATGRPFTGTAVRPYRSGRVATKPEPKRRQRPAPPPRDRSSWFAELAPPDRVILIRIMDANPKLDALAVVALFASEVAP